MFGILVKQNNHVFEFLVGLSCFGVGLFGKIYPKFPISFFAMKERIFSFGKQWCGVKLPILVALFLIACSLEVFAVPSTPDTIIVSAASLAKGINLLDSVRLCFHAGDDMRWKDPNFDNSAWQMVRSDTAGRVLPSGIGWFRVYLRVMPDAASTIATVWTEPYYAAQETYLDGKLLCAAGVPSAQAEQERVAYFSEPRISFPTVPLPLTSATVHFLALRLST